MNDIFDYSQVSSFLSSHFADHSFAFLHGSRAKGTARADSDVDLIIIFESNDVSPRREIIRHGKYVYDVSVLSLTGMKTYLDSAPVTCNYRPAYMLENAIVLPSGCIAAGALIQKARNLLRVMQRPTTTDGFKIYLTSLLTDIRYASSRSERIFLMTDAYRSITEFISHWHGRRGGRKYAFETIQRFEPNLLADLNNQFADALSADNSDHFVLFAERFLEKIGAPLVGGLMHQVGPTKE